MNFPPYWGTDHVWDLHVGYIDMCITDLENKHVFLRNISDIHYIVKEVYLIGQIYTWLYQHLYVIRSVGDLVNRLYIGVLFVDHT